MDIKNEETDIDIEIFTLIKNARKEGYSLFTLNEIGSGYNEVYSINDFNVLKCSEEKKPKILEALLAKRFI